LANVFNYFVLETNEISRSHRRSRHRPTLLFLRRRALPVDGGPLSRADNDHGYSTSTSSRSLSSRSLSLSVVRVRSVFARRSYTMSARNRFGRPPGQFPCTRCVNGTSRGLCFYFCVRRRKRVYYRRADEYHQGPRL